MIVMSCQHKRPGRAARFVRKERAARRAQAKDELARRRSAIVVHFPHGRRRFDGFSPGRCMAWADGRF